MSFDQRQAYLPNVEAVYKSPEAYVQNGLHGGWFGLSTPFPLNR